MPGTSSLNGDPHNLGRASFGTSKTSFTAGSDEWRDDQLVNDGGDLANRIFSRSFHPPGEGIQGRSRRADSAEINWNLTDPDSHPLASLNAPIPCLADEF